MPVKQIEKTIEKNTQQKLPKEIEEMFTAGAHFGFSKSRRHPSFKAFIYGQKNNTEILNLEKTEDLLGKALKFVSALGEAKKTILFVGGKSEAKEIIKRSAESIGAPYVAGRWIGGTITNFDQIKKRVARLEDLISKREKGELGKYTKKERLNFDKEIENLLRFFGGIRTMSKIPDALFVVDSKNEAIAITEARKFKIPVIALSSSDCDLTVVTHPIPANDTSRSSIEYFVGKIVDAYKASPIK
jgi:small subunit ribosomal protein S2